MDVLEQLIVEHRVVEALLSRMDRCDRASRNIALMELVDVLSTHMEVEERAVHPFVEARLGRQRATDADEQHDNVRHTLSQLFEVSDDDEQFAGTLAKLTVDFGEHVTSEEQDLFPALRRGAAASEVAALGEAHRVEANQRWR